MAPAGEAAAIAIINSRRGRWANDAMILAQVAACPVEAQMLDKAKKSALDVSGLRTRYDNFIGGAWRAPEKGRYFTNKSPIDGSTLC